MNLSPQNLILISLGVALIPTLLGVFTSYLKISIVLGMLKNALGTQSTPSGLVVMALSLVLSLFVMFPIIEQVSNNLQKRDLKSLSFSISSIQSLKEEFSPLIEFMKKNASEREIIFFKTLHKESDSDSLMIIAPSFLLTELREAFSMALLLLLPFAIIDMVVANILGGLGMFMVTPTLLSLPLKLLVFTMGDGWLYLSKILLASYGVGNA